MVFSVQLVGTIVAIAMLFRTFRKDNDEKLDQKAPRTELVLLQKEVDKKADQKTFDVFKEEYDKQMKYNEDNHREIKMYVKDMTEKLSDNLGSQIKLVNDNVDKYFKTLIKLYREQAKKEN
jgi:hypothetical protein